MNTLRNQTIALVIIMLSAIGGTGYFAYKALNKYFFYQNQIAFGKEVIKTTEKIIDKKHSKENFKKLQHFRSQLDEKTRQENFSKVIQAYDEKSKFLAKKRLNFFKSRNKNTLNLLKNNTRLCMNTLGFMAL